MSKERYNQINMSDYRIKIEERNNGSEKRYTLSVDEIINGEFCPLPLKVIPNYMGINLVSVESIDWTEQEDGQLVNLTINFKPE